MSDHETVSVGGDYLHTGVLVGRRLELTEMTRVLERAASGSGALLVLHGPRGAGKSVLVSEMVAAATERGFTVRRAAAAPGLADGAPWSALAIEIGASNETALALMQRPDAIELADCVTALTSTPRSLVIVEDVDPESRLAARLVPMLVARLPLTSSAVVVTSTRSLAPRHGLGVRPLSEDDLGRVVSATDPDLRHAVWLASAGLPGRALTLTRELDGTSPHGNRLVSLAMAVPRSGGFFELDHGLVRLLERALDVADEPQDRARLMGRLASELRVDVTAEARRRQLADDALALCGSDSPGLRAEILDDRLQALWDPDAADERLDVATEIIDLARAAGDLERVRQGLFWRFLALMELGRLTDAEGALKAYASRTAVAGDASGLVMVTARRAMLAILRGRFADADLLIATVRRQGVDADVADTPGLVWTLRSTVTGLRRDAATASGLVPGVADLARRLPGQYFEVLTAAWLAVSGRHDEAAAEVDRILPQVLAGSGPNWVWAVAELSFATVTAGHPTAAERLYPALLPYAGRLVLFSGAATVLGPVSYYLGLLATHLGRPDEAVRHLTDATEWSAENGALPWLAHGLAALADARERRGAEEDRTATADARARCRDLAQRLGLDGLLEVVGQPGTEWSLLNEGGDWVLVAGDERGRLRDSAGLRQLRLLLGAPGRDVSALDLAAGGAGLQVGVADTVFDADAAASYRAHLQRLSRLLEEADEVGDAAESERLTVERDAVLGQLRRDTGLAGRVRQTSNEAERARVNTTRTLRAALHTIVLVAPKAGAHLIASLRTGHFCRYEPGPGGPDRWQI